MEEQRENLREEMPTERAEEKESALKTLKERRKSGRMLMVTIMVVAVAVAAVAVCWMLTREKPEEKAAITDELIFATLEPASELTTARLTYCGLIRYSEGKIPLINKKAFSMLYCAEVETGVDLSKVEVTVTDTAVEIGIPPLAEPDIEVLPETIEFFDEKSSIFNPEEKQDTLDAISVAKADVLEKADLPQLTQTAKEQAQLLIVGLLQPVVEGRSVVVTFR